MLTSGWDRAVVSRGEEAKTTKRFINTVVIYPPENPTRETLLDASRITPLETEAATTVAGT